jgi:Spx/MgsR family transcriptional regulator
MTTLYGIRNCDTIKKARRWLEENGIEYRFHDVRTDGISRADLQHWIQTLDWENLLNRRSTSWRKLPESVRNNINKTSATSIMLDNPAIIKRPVLARGDKLYLGFSVDSYQSIFQLQAHS